MYCLMEINEWMNEWMNRKQKEKNSYQFNVKNREDQLEQWLESCKNKT